MKKYVCLQNQEHNRFQVTKQQEGRAFKKILEPEYDGDGNLLNPEPIVFEYKCLECGAVYRKTIMAKVMEIRLLDSDGEPTFLVRNFETIGGWTLPHNNYSQFEGMKVDSGKGEQVGPSSDQCLDNARQVYEDLKKVFEPKVNCEENIVE